MLGFLRRNKRKPVIFLKNPDGTFAGSKQVSSDDSPDPAPEIQVNDRVLANKMLRQTQADMKDALELARTLREEGLKQLTDQAKFNDIIDAYAGENYSDNQHDDFESMAGIILKEVMEERREQRREQRKNKHQTPESPAESPDPEPGKYPELSKREKIMVDGFAERVPKILFSVPTPKLAAAIEYLKGKYKPDKTKVEVPHEKIQV